MNSQLSSYFMECKVKVALNQMAPLKSPGPDSMPPLFYQHYWDLVGKDISTSVLSFLNSASLHDYLNHTFITLIRKVKNPKLVSEFWLISLCNVLYQIFSKLLANMLKKILPHIITLQSAFTKDQLISNNILTAIACKTIILPRMVSWLSRLTWARRITWWSGPSLKPSWGSWGLMSARSLSWCFVFPLYLIQFSLTVHLLVSLGQQGV